MFELVLMAVMVVTASRDGEFLVVQVPPTWDHVEIDTDPPADFTKIENEYWGRTPAKHGTVYAAICDEDSCTPVESQFQVEGRTGLLWLLGLALVAGMAMNVTPCVFPVIGLKLASMKDKEAPYIAGALLSFLILGLLAASLGAGLSHMSSWGYRALLAVTCYTVALQFLGWLHLPGFGTRTRSPFFLGVLSVALGSSCTVPFIAPVLVASTVLPGYQTVLLFLVMGIGFVSPFLMPIHKLLPKPGPWMVWYERACGVAMLVVAGWLASTLPPAQAEPVNYPTSGARAIVVTGNFCINCKFVMPLWEDPEVRDALTTQGVEVTTLDWSNGDKSVTRLLDSYGVRAIPFALVVNQNGRETVLTGIYSKQDILDALK